MRLVPIECVRDNSRLGKSIYDEEGRVLLQAGVELTEAVINKMHDLQIFSIYIIDEYSEDEIEEIIRPEVRHKSITVVKETFNNIERIKTKGEIGPKAALKKKNREYFYSIYSVAEELLNEILSNDNVLLSLVDIKSMDNYTYQHCVNVAVISLVMGISMKMTKDELIELCIGALIHDIGKSFIPKEITLKNGELTDEEFEIYKEHPIRGCDYLRKNFYFKPSTLQAILQHHERIDGQGFPKRVAGDKIHLFAKIIAIANKYDKLTSYSSYKKTLSSSDALEYIMSQANLEFDFELICLFTRVIIAYPAGTLIKLSNEDIAISISTPANFPLRPLVEVVQSKHKERIGKKINLLKEISLVINEVVYEIEG